MKNGVRDAIVGIFSISLSHCMLSFLGLRKVDYLCNMKFNDGICWLSIKLCFPECSFIFTLQIVIYLLLSSKILIFFIALNVTAREMNIKM